MAGSEHSPIDIFFWRLSAGGLPLAIGNGIHPTYPHLQCSHYLASDTNSPRKHQEILDVFAVSTQKYEFWKYSLVYNSCVNICWHRHWSVKVELFTFLKICYCKGIAVNMVSMVDHSSRLVFSHTLFIGESLVQDSGTCMATKVWRKHHNQGTSHWSKICQRNGWMDDVESHLYWHGTLAMSRECCLPTMRDINFNFVSLFM